MRIRKTRHKHAHARLHYSERRIGETCQWLRDLLASGPLYQKDVQDKAAACGIPHGQLSEARKRLGIELSNLNTRNTYARWGVLFWSLPRDHQTSSSGVRT